MRSGIPYKVIGGMRFYDRREIKDVVAYLRAAINPVDEVSIGHALIADALELGLAETVRRYKAACATLRDRS